MMMFSEPIVPDRPIRFTNTDVGVGVPVAPHCNWTEELDRKEPLAGLSVIAGGIITVFNNQ